MSEKPSSSETFVVAAALAVSVANCGRTADPNYPADRGDQIIDCNQPISLRQAMTWGKGVLARTESNCDAASFYAPDVERYEELILSDAYYRGICTQPITLYDAKLYALALQQAAADKVNLQHLSVKYVSVAGHDSASCQEKYRQCSDKDFLRVTEKVCKLPDNTLDGNSVVYERGKLKAATYAAASCTKDAVRCYKNAINDALNRATSTADPNNPALDRAD